MSTKEGPVGRRSLRTSRLHDWYARNADAFVNSATIQPNRVFEALSPEQQRRLNRFKLWFLQSPDLISLEGKSVLEFGCGHGRMALETSGYESYLGVDFVEAFVKLGEERIEVAGLSDRARLEHSDCLQFSGPLEAFDVVGALGMFEFVEYPEYVVAKMASHLKPGGKLFIDAHSSSILYNAARRRRHRRIEAEGGVPKRFFGGSEIRDLFEQAGLEDVQILMKEWPFLGSLYAKYGSEGIFKFRNLIAPMRWLHPLGTDFVAIGTKPS